MTKFCSQSAKSSRSVKVFLLSGLALLLFVAGSYAQSAVKGTVTDNAGDPLPGVSVLVKGTGNGTITDINGKYSIQATGRDVLTFTYVGMMPQDIRISNRTVIHVMMLDDVAALEEVIVVGYGVQKKSSLTGAVSAIKGEELLKAPSTNVSQMLGGVLPGISSVQESGEPGLDQASLRIRGSQYAVTYIVDGMPRSINDIDPNDIESVSVLKDGAAAAVYGLQAAGGVIIITTKKGNDGRAKVTYHGSVGVSLNANFPQFMNGPQFAYYYNVADMMDKLASGVIKNESEYKPIFTREDVAKMTNGDPTDGWDNVNYIDKVFGTGMNQKHSVTVQGGTDKTRFFASIGYLGQQGNIDNFDYNRYNLRTNLETEVAKHFQLSLGISGNVSKRQTPGYVSGGTDSDSYLGEQGWFSVAHQTIGMHPYLPEKIDGMYTGVAPRNNTSIPNSPLAAIYDSGYKQTRGVGIQTNLSLQYNVPWVKGLNLKVSGAYDYSTSRNKNLDTYYYVKAIQLPTIDKKTEYVNMLDPKGRTYNQLGEGQYNATSLIGQGSVNYANVFGKHSVEGMVLLEVRDYKENSLSAYAKNVAFPELPELGLSSPADDPIGGWSKASRSAGYVFRLKYDYDKKYLAEVTGRYDGSYKFAGNVSGKRWGFFPSASVAWRISKETFMSEFDFLDDMKVRASVGLLGNDNVTPYSFLSTYSFGNKLPLSGGLQNSLYTSAIANPNLSWEKTLSYNVGFDFSMWNGLIGLDFDAFYNYSYDMLIEMSAGYPPSMGGYFPSYANYNKMDSKGFEVLVSHKNKFNLAGKSFNYNIAGNATYAITRWLRYPDSPNDPEIQKRTGKKYGLISGWTAEGLFRSEEEIDNSAWYGSRPNVGDIKYKDLNGDGKIDYQDRGLIGRSNRPELTFGLNLGGEWNGFDFNAQFTGGALFDVSLTGTYFNGYDDNTIWTQTFKEGSNSPLFLVENAYSVYNPNGTFPRITLSSATHGGDNGLASTFWFRDGKYVRLKSAQIGYTIPRKLLQKANIENLRFFVEGSNIFTISGLPQGIDPEFPGVNNGYYPQQKTFMGGVTLTF